MPDEHRKEKQAHSGTIDGQNITRHNTNVSSVERARILRHEPTTIWLTGLSGAGKSTIAYALEQQLIQDGRLAYVLDGDNVRHGLNRDLGFSPQDRTENIRRIAEVAKLFNEAGLLVITAFISPYRQDRTLAQDIIGAHRFIEVHVSTTLQICEERDPKGLYKKVRAGQIAEFTGISAPYEAPENPALTLDTNGLTITESILKILQKLTPRFY
jgi:adenylylsulfate kinase